MESLRILLDAGDFDRIVCTGQPEAGDLVMAIKLRATKGGKPGVAIGFSAYLADGRRVFVQAVTTLELLRSAVSAFEARAEGGRP